MTGYGGGREGAIEHIFDILAAAPEGMTAPQIAAIMNCSKSWVQENIRGLKLFFEADGDKITVVCNRDPLDPGGPQIYTLVGNLEGARENFGVNLQKVESTLVTLNAQVGSLLNGTDKRTRDGKKLVRMKRGLDFMVGQMADDREDITA